MEIPESDPTIVCCMCGVSISPNPSYKCMPCLRLTHDISENIPKELTIHFCRGCDRYLQPPSQWITAALESRELLSLCLKRIRGLDKVKLIDASFDYTEPHSRRLKINLIIQKEIDIGAAIEQAFTIEYVVAHQFCADCHRVEAKEYWKASLQIRQKVDHKRTFYYLEQLMLKNNIARLTSSINAENGGLDMFFMNEREAKKVVDFISSSVICKTYASKKLISHDMKSNIYNHKFSFSLEIAPICKDSAVCLPAVIARNLAGMSRVCIVLRATSSIVLIDPATAHIAEVKSLSFGKSPFPQLCTSKMLKKFLVLEYEESDVKYFIGQGQISHKHTVADVWVQHEADIGTDKKIFCRTHIGKYINIGDIVLGYDLRTTNVNNDELDKLKDDLVPDVLLVKKYYGDKSLRNKRRKWKLRSMGVDDKNSQNKDYMDFLEELEEDDEMRGQVNVYHNSEAAARAALHTEGDAENDLEPDTPAIPVEEMLAELAIEEPPAATGEAGEEENWADAQEVMDHM